MIKINYELWGLSNLSEEQVVKEETKQNKKLTNIVNKYIMDKSIINIDLNVKYRFLNDVFNGDASPEIITINENIEPTQLFFHSSFFYYMDPANFWNLNLICNHEIKSSKIVSEDNKSSMEILKNRFLGGFFGNFLTNKKRSVVISLQNNQSLIFKCKSLDICGSLNDRFQGMIKNNKKEIEE